MIILGIDPGLTCCGYSLLTEKNGWPLLLDYGMIKTNPKDPIQIRCLELYERFSVEVIPKYKPDLIAIENQFMGRNIQTALKIVMSKTSCLLAGATHRVPVVQYQPTTVKTTICKAFATKESIKKKLECIFGYKIDGSLDVTDSIAVAFTALRLHVHVRHTI